MSPTVATVDRIARSLNRHRPGWHARVLTAQWEEHWPRELLVRDVPVTRFPNQSWSLLHRTSLGSRISEWLASYADRWDVVVVVGNLEGGDEILATAQSLGRLSAIQLVETGPETVFENSEILQKYQRKLGRWFQHPMWITTNPNSAGAICSQNPDAAVAIWNLGLPARQSLALGTGQKAETRNALISSHPVLRGSRFLPLVVYDGPYDEPEAALWLWRLVKQLFADRSDFRLWLCGDGPGLSRLYHSIVSDGLEELVLLPGYFSCKEDLYAAADLILLPNLGRDESLSFLTAVGQHTPFLVGKQAPVQHVAAAVRSEVATVQAPSPTGESHQPATAEDCAPYDPLENMGLAPQVTAWHAAIDRHLEQPDVLEQAVRTIAHQFQQLLSEAETLDTYCQLLETPGDTSTWPLD